ncbi:MULTISPECIES: citryl-CoA lyase [Chelativorans]|jgi:citrate synthase|uniref:citrate synthase (unknown stereospecificity) n=1 Tax=Chelativorans sp. (strain BNC1) TaxID=266779 RepID=Q11AS0_CHESB|nr:MULTISPECIES: citryl-CoA lyase [Chelativorans]
MPQITTRIAHADKDSVTIRGFDLAADLIGERSFTDVLYLLMKGSLPPDDHRRILDACLVTLMEHGWTPSSLIARLMIDSVPDEMQVGMSAGLLSLGNIFAGTSEACAKLLVSGERSGQTPEDYCNALVAEYRQQRKPVPGFGHPLHKPTDPRATKLLVFADELGVSGRYVDLLRKLSAAMDRAAGKPITLNATGAIAALLLEIGLPADVMRGLAVVSRSGGLIAHIQEERETHLAREIWSYVENNIPYEK